MQVRRILRRVAVALLLIAGLLAQETWALAGTTGGINGYVRDVSNNPVANVLVTVNSPSEREAVRTDASGHFTFLTLPPDTYTISAAKDGFNPVSETGVTIFADQVQALNLEIKPQLKIIARVTSRAAGDLVKPGTTADIYSVNSTSVAKAGALGGGGNLDSAYSAIASVPGVSVATGGAGWNQGLYIRGSQSFFSSFEYDGVPVNRAFDNYDSSTESNLGLQELQVYTGGGPASDSSAGTSGFINQVIRTGTYPGFATLGAGVSAPQYYHQAKVEAGGSNPDRTFSYYAGISGYDQGFRYFDNSNANSLVQPNGVLGLGTRADAASCRSATPTEQRRRP